MRRELWLRHRDFVRLVIVATLFAGMLAFAGSVRAPIASSETRFVEYSKSGLQIVPASCPSNPHYSGECSGGGSGWNIPPGGRVPLPYPTTDASCTAGTPFHMYVRTADSDSTQVRYSVAWNDGTPYEDTGWMHPLQVYTSTRTFGSALGTQVGYVMVYDYEGNYSAWIPFSYACSASASQCTQQFFCQGNDLWVSNKGNVCSASSLEQRCAWRCASGQCLPPPESEVDIRVTPPLARFGGTTLVAWEASNVTSCTVSENNPLITDSWSGGEAGCGNGACNASHQSSEITQATRYTLSCIGVDGNTYTDAATVNIIPVWTED